MHFRPFRSVSALTFTSALFLGLVTSASAAGTKDKDAQKLYDSAINEDYLNADFAKAEKKLKDAVTKCGNDCSDELVGKIHVALGTVYAIGLSKTDEAKAEFIAALKADPKAALDPSLTTPDLTKLFEEAKKASAAAPPKPSEAEAKPAEKSPKAPPAGDATHTPPPESQVNTPLPLYVEPSDEVPLSKVTLRYKPFGATQYKSVEMKKVGKGYGAEIPCEDVTTTGDVKYYFVFTGDDGDGAGGLGSSRDPFKTTVKNEIEGDAPKLPGKKAPEQCKEKGDCPPGLPGCDSGKVKHGDKGWGSSCDQTAECKEGLACLNGTCEEDKGGDKGREGGEESSKKKRMNLVGAGVELDFLNLGSGSNVCAPPVSLSAPASNHVCFIQGSSTQIFATPIVVANTDGIQGGGAFAGARLLAAYDRQLLSKVALTAGLRIGYAFGGPGAPTNVNAQGNPTGLAPGIPSDTAPAKPFHPLHLEARLSYYLLGSMMDAKALRPYVFVGGGYGQVNASVDLQMCDSNVGAGETANCPKGVAPNNGLPLTTPAILRTVNAYQITGLDFVDFGVGTTFGITPLFGLSAELKFMFMFPTFGVVISPSLGPVFNF